MAALHSKDMPPLGSFGPVFVRNQFRTTIELPTRSRYPQVQGKCAVITGSNTGLGFEASKQLLDLGLSRLIMGVRSLEKGNQAAKELSTSNPSATIDVWHLDMESYESIQAFTRRCDDETGRIDYVILNAGISPYSFALSRETGHEKTIQTNHISTMLLAILLLPVLKRRSQQGSGSPATMTFVNSVMAELCKFPTRNERPLLPPLDDPSRIPWDGGERYGLSKLLCQLMVVKLAEILSPEDVILNMTDPGLTKGTDLAREVTGVVALVMKVFVGLSGRPVSQGAAIYVDAIVRHGKESHGCFMMNNNIAP